MDHLLSMFDDVTAHWWSVVTPSQAEIVVRKAKASLDVTGDPQGVHTHAEGEPCVRGGGCFVLKAPR